MSVRNTFGVVGGDERQLYLAASIARDGYPVYISCLEKAPGAAGLPALELEEIPLKCGIILLPLPATRDGRLLNAPFSRREVILDDEFAGMFTGKAVYGGMMEKLRAASKLWESAGTRDYYAREELVVGNAFLTAEGAIGLAIREHPGALSGSRCLVTGFGRIGKALCLALRGLGARVDCCARKAEDLAAIRAMGCGALRYREIGPGYDVVFNTVPALVLTAPALEKQRKDTLFLELASQPGGIDRAAAERLGLRVVDGPSLPGKMSPKASGELIKETVYNMMEEL